MKKTILFLAIVVSGTMFAQINEPSSQLVKQRMNTALQRAKTARVPAWCNTDSLKAIRKIVVDKCVRTLYGNYLPVGGDVFHEGVMPSPTTFPGLWAWDSWKHAYALAWLDKNLAKNSVRAMFDYQDKFGMIADCIFTKKTENNYRDSKPPLSVWAVYEIYLKSRDLSFLKEMYPKLLKYHYWWYKYRDSNKNGLCEYGSTDNTLQAARWESGWDNAVRFDDAKMLKNEDGAYSMTVESVDLNAYLFVEKEKMIDLARLVGDLKTEKQLIAEKKKLKLQIQTEFWDSKTGFFYDKDITSNTLIMSKEPSGWLPLWAKIATNEQAKAVKTMMMESQTFNTFVPMPTVSYDSKKFDPSKGYWRGPVWIDQFYFGYKGLQNYGFVKEANSLLMKLLKNAEGIIVKGASLRENYSPVDGKGLGALNFGWTAACLYLMMTE